MAANRNPTGIRVGQTWYSKNPLGHDADEIKITSVFGDLIWVETKKGITLSTDELFIKTNYRLDATADLFGEA